MTAFNSIFLRDATVATQGAKVDTFGTQFVNLRTSGGVELGTAATPITAVISGTVPISGTVTGNQGAPNTVANAWPQKITDGTNTAAISTALELSVGGSVASGIADAGNPQKIGGRATTALTAVAAAQRTNQAYDVLGRLVTTPTLPDAIVSSQVLLSAITATTLLPALASQRNYIHSILLSNGSSTGTTVLLTDAAIGTLLQVYLPAATPGLTYSLPIPIRGGLNSALTAQLSVATASGGVYVHVSGYTSPY